MSIGKKYINPLSQEVATAEHGLTYREWLIGQGMSGLTFTKLNGNTAKEVAEIIINQADAIIELLDKENK